jgi:hypothetical protein
MQARPLRLWRTGTRSLRRSLTGSTLLALAATSSLSTAHADVAITKVNIGLPNTVVLLITGGFNGNEILRVKSAIAELPPTTRVIAALESPGGRVDQGQALGTFFYEARIPTLLLANSLCASACTDAFFGGRDPVTNKPLRIMASGSKLGFHNIKFEIKEGDYTKKNVEDVSRVTQQATYEQIKFMKSVEAPMEALLLQVGTKAESMNFITEGEALKYGINILNVETGKLVSPANLDSRTQRTP